MGGLAISTALWWWDTITQVKAPSLPTYTPPPTHMLPMCVFGGGGWVHVWGRVGNCPHYPQVMGENVLLMETGDILLKFTANLNLMGHNLSSWRKETPFTWELLFGSYKWVTGKRSQCQRADSGAYYKVRCALLSKGKYLSLSFPNWLNPKMDVKNIAEHYFICPFL